MRCTRCDGLMIYEKFYSLVDSFYGHRCVLCGEITDETIEANRAFHCQPKHKPVRLPGKVTISKLDDNELFNASAAALYDEYGFSRSTVSKERTKRRSGPDPMQSETGRIARGRV